MQRRSLLVGWRREITETASSKPPTSASARSPGRLPPLALPLPCRAIAAAVTMTAAVLAASIAVSVVRQRCINRPSRPVPTTAACRLLLTSAFLLLRLRHAPPVRRIICSGEEHARHLLQAEPVPHQVEHPEDGEDAGRPHGRPLPQQAGQGRALRRLRWPSPWGACCNTMCCVMPAPAFALPRPQPAAAGLGCQPCCIGTQPAGRQCYRTCSWSTAHAYACARQDCACLCCAWFRCILVLNQPLSFLFSACGTFGGV